MKPDPPRARLRNRIIEAMRDTTEPEDPALVYAINRATDDLVGSPSFARTAERSIRRDWADPQLRRKMQLEYEEVSKTKAEKHRERE
jgi:hypothetical protein